VKVTITAPESWKRVLEIEIPKEEADAAYKEKLTSYTKKLALPGFRPGKVPATLVKSRFGQSIFAETVEDIIQTNFEKACKDNNIVPIAKGGISKLSGEEGTDVSFTIEAEIEPEIEIKGYEKLKIKASPKKIGDKEIENVLNELQERFTEFKEVERPAKKGDALTIVYEKVTIDGEERTDMKSPTAPFELGKGELKDFDKGLTGTKANDIIDISVSFPKDFISEQLAGKKGVFTVKVVKVSEKIVPEFNEEFLTKTGNFKTLDELKDNIRQDLERQEQERAKNEAYDKAIDELISENPFDVPPSRIESYIDHLTEEMTKYRRQNEPVPTREELVAKYKDTAIRSLKRFRIIDFVAGKEKIKASQEDVDREIQKIADMYNQPFDTIKQAFRQNGTTNRIRADVRDQRTLEFLIGEYTPAVSE
jgi:trigger factor